MAWLKFACEHKYIRTTLQNCIFFFFGLSTELIGSRAQTLWDSCFALKYQLLFLGDKSEVLDVDNPDLEKFPEFAKATKYECILEPGDVLFIPGMSQSNDFTVDTTKELQRKVL